MAISVTSLTVKSFVVDNGSAGDTMAFTILLADMHWRGKVIVEWRYKIGRSELARGDLAVTGRGRDPFPRVKRTAES